MEKRVNIFRVYLEQLGYHPKSIKKHGYQIEEFRCFMENHGLLKLEEIGIKQILSYQKHLQKRPNKVRAGKLSETTIYHKLRSVELLFEMLEAKDEIKENPLSELQLKAPKRHQRKLIVTEVEINELYEVCQDHKERSLLSLGYGCGLRVGEIERLHIKDLNFNDGYLVVEKGKGNKRRIIPMSTGVMDMDPPISDLAFRMAACLVHFSMRWISSIWSPLPAEQLVLKQVQVLVLG